MGGKSQNTGILGPFGLGRPLALEKSRGWAENGNKQFPGARGTYGKKIRTPQKFLPESAQLFYITFWPTGPPEIAKYGGFRPFWPRAALGTERNFGAQNRKTQTATLRAKREKQNPFSSVLIPSLG